MRKFLLAVWLLTGLLSAACSSSVPGSDIDFTPTLDGTLRPYPSPTSSVTPLPTDYMSPTPTPTVTPTPTLVFYEVGANDDMYGIGWRFNVSPAQIMTANPSVNPRAMGPGTTLLIPITPNPNPTAAATEQVTPTATPIFYSIGQPDCYPDALGGLWCFILAVNEQGKAVENISGTVTLYDEEEWREEPAIMPLNLLPAGEVLPLISYFHPPLPSNYSISASVDFLLPVMPIDQRYLPVAIEGQSLHLNENKLIAEVSGQLTLPEKQPKTRYLWLNATAFDKDGHIVAVRRWESPAQLSGGEQVSFKIFLYSLGEPIDRVELLAEAQPRLSPSQGD